LEPGGRIVLVNDQAAFEARYGAGLSAQIAGEYSGNLSNDGELLSLIGAAGGPIHSFSYNDRSPWPQGPDGDGFGLVLIDPMQSPVPDHSDPLNWRASVEVGAAPGLADGTTYSEWKIANGIPTPEVDSDIDDDGRENFLEYFEGTLAGSPDVSAASASIESIDVGGVVDDYFVFRFRRNLAADDVTVEPELSADLVSWTGGVGEVEFVGRERISPTAENLIFRSAAPTSSLGRVFGRVRVESR
ncbi:MAG: hypothetical protein ACR2RV_10645, partial [Verrucomicrobiales bacterium]